MPSIALKLILACAVAALVSFAVAGLVRRVALTRGVVVAPRPGRWNLAPTTLRSYRAGWGYLLLTRGLIWEGQAPFKLWAFAFDGEGSITTLGSKTITINNAASIKPFGAIDTPGQGETVGGTINNFGWVIPSKGSTISQAQVQVFVDDVFIGNPGGMSARADLDAAFTPAGFDTTQANRVLAIDTTRFAKRRAHNCLGGDRQLGPGGRCRQPVHQDPERRVAHNADDECRGRQAAIAWARGS